MPYLVPNKGSAARDFCMLERNFLSHLKLAILFSLLSSSLLLRARLVPEPDLPHAGDKASIPLAGVLFAAGLTTLGAGAWEYNVENRDLMKMTAFLQAIKSVFPILRLSCHFTDMLQHTSCCYHSYRDGSICDMHRADCVWIITQSYRGVTLFNYLNDCTSMLGLEDRMNYTGYFYFIYQV